MKRAHCTGTESYTMAETEARLPEGWRTWGRLMCRECGGIVDQKKDGTLRKHVVGSNRTAELGGFVKECGHERAGRRADGSSRCLDCGAVFRN